MKRLLFSIFVLIISVAVFAQKREEGFDYSFKPTTNAPRYFVVTEKKILSGFARHGTYQKEECTCRVRTKTAIAT
jgi:hypothetical protein